jgi:hypothetical protein
LLSQKTRYLLFYLFHRNDSSSPVSEGLDGSDNDNDEDEDAETTATIMDDTVEQQQDLNNDDCSSEDGGEDENNENLPHDDAEVLSTDEETKSHGEPIQSTDFDVEHVARLLAKCRKLVNTVDKSNILYEAVQKLAQPNPPPSLVIDMRVRWGSTYKMLQRLLLHRPILIKATEVLSPFTGITVRQRQVIEYSYLSEGDWHVINVLCRCLEIFADASDMLSGSHYPSLALSYPVLESLEFYLNSFSDDEVESSIK